MESITKLRKVGGSIVATVPRNVIEFEGLMPGQIVRIKIEKIKKSGFGALKGIGSFTKEDELWMEGNHIHFEAKKKNKDFGMLDAFVAATAKKFNAKILTGDEHFKQFKEAVFI